MPVARYRLTIAGKLGAALFVACPIIAAVRAIPAKPKTASEKLDQRLAEINGDLFIFNQTPETLIALGGLTLVGAVLLLIGREIITHDR